MKTLSFAVFLTIFTVPTWALGDDVSEQPPLKKRVPVEVLIADGKKEWIMLEVPHEAVPEPSALVLTMLSTLVLLRRNRGK